MSIRRALPILTLLLARENPAAAELTVTVRPGPASSAVTNGDAFAATGPGNTLNANNYGNAGALAVAAAGSAKGAFSTVIRFDISAAQTAFDSAYGVAGWTLKLAVLRLTTTIANNPLFNASMPGKVRVNWLADDTWLEGTGNPNSPSFMGVNWNVLGTLLEASEFSGLFAVNAIGDGITTDFQLTIPQELHADVAAGGSVGFALTPGDGEVAVLFNSRNFGTASRNPSLILTAVPVLPQITKLVPTSSTGRFQLHFTSKPGLRVVLQTSADLQNWSDSPVTLTTSASNHITVTTSPEDAPHYWRLKRLLP